MPFYLLREIRRMGFGKQVKGALLPITARRASRLLRLYFRTLVLGKEPRDLGVELLLFGEVSGFVAEFDEVLDLELECLGLVRGLLGFADLIFIVHVMTLLQSGGCAAKLYREK